MDDERTRAFREAIAKSLRDDGASDEEIAAALSRIHRSVVWARTRDRRNARGVGNIETTAGVETGDGIEPIERLRRRWTGTGGAPRDTGVTFEKAVSALVDKWNDLRDAAPTQSELAEHLGVSDRWLRQRGGHYEEIVDEARRRLETRD
jgi:hypothetical protein